MKTAPQIFYGLHMVEGVAEYRKAGTGEPYRVLVPEDACKLLDPSFAGKPVFLQHVDEVNLATLEHEADGWVIESFFNLPDGKHWAKFIAVTDKAQDAIKSGFVLSNCYEIDGKGAGGKWHGVDYEYEVTRGTYEHLAIVNDPRYAESIILTPEQFKEYNESKLAEIAKHKNSNDETKEEPMFKMFKKEAVKNSADYTDMSLVLPKSGREVTLLRLVNDADEEAMNGRKANDEDKVESKGMTVGDLIKKNAELEEASKKHEDEKKNFLDSSISIDASQKTSVGNDAEAKVEEKKENDAAPGEDGAKIVEEKKENEAEQPPKKEDDNARKDNAAEGKVESDKKEDDKKAVEGKAENETDDKEKEKASNALHFDALKNAENAATLSNGLVFELPQDKVTRGKSRYGSKQ